MSIMIRVFLQKALFTFLIIVSLSSILSAMEDNAFNEAERGGTFVRLKDDAPVLDVFQPSPPSTLWGKSADWLWNKGGTWLDRITIGATTIGGQCLGNVYEDVVSNYVASSMGAMPTRLCYNVTQLNKIEETYIRENRKEIMRQGTRRYSSPYDALAGNVGAVAGYFVGVGITKTRQWVMDKLIQCYPSVKSSCLNLMYSFGWKLADKARELKGE
jgi:hypothetical protein